MIDSSFLTLSDLASREKSGLAPEAGWPGLFGIVPAVNKLTDFFRKWLRDGYVNFYFDRVVNEIDEDPSNAGEILSFYGISEEQDRRKIAEALSLRNPSWVEWGLFTKPFEQAIELVLKEKKEDAVRRIRTVMQRRLSDVESEFARLKEVKRIDGSLKNITRYLPLTVEEQVAVAQSIELREELQSDFYIFNHGENNSATVLNIVAKKAAELFQAKKYECFEILRDEIFLKEVPKERDVNWYKNRFKTSLECDNDYRNELICGDIVLENTDRWESAIHFFSGGRKNVAVHENPLFIPNLLKKIVKKYFSEDSFAESVSNELWEISKELQGGTLYSICIPKKTFSSLGYLSLPYGVPFEDQSRFDLASLQNGMGDWWGNTPQVRLLTSKLTEKRGVLMIPHSTLPRIEIDKIEQAVRNCLLNAAKRYPVSFDPTNLTG